MTKKEWVRMAKYGEKYLTTRPIQMSCWRIMERELYDNPPARSPYLDKQDQNVRKVAHQRRLLGQLLKSN
jgi:hypothetical protein